MSNEVKKEAPKLLQKAIEEVTNGLQETFTPRNFDLAELQKAQQEGSLPQSVARGVIASGVADIYANGYPGHSVGFNALGREYVEEKLRQKGLNVDESRMLAAHKALAA